MNDFLFSGRLIKACAPILALGLLNSSMTWAQAPAKLWDQRYGGTLPDGLETVVATTDGGSLLAGTTASSATGDQSRPRKGSVADYWVVKITATGAKQWEHNFGGANYQHLRAAVQTRDGGYLLGGFSASNASHDKSQNSRGTDDFWIVKLDAQGNKEWDRTYGGNNTDRLMALQQTADGGYVLGGTSASGSGGDKTEGNRGDRDYWVVKIDAAGVKQWDKTLGSRGGDYLFALQQTRDGGYVLGGESRGGVGADKTEPSWGGDDMWVVKLDAQGAREWDKTVGSFGDEELRVVRQLPGGHYLLGGASDGGPDGDKTQGSNGLKDYWLVELATNGNKLRDQAWGGSDFDRLAGLELLPDGGLLLGGYSRSGAGGDKTHPSRGDYDYWVVRLDAQGRKRWDQSVGSAAKSERGLPAFTCFA